MNKLRPTSARGFTLIELLIATSVFTMVLLLITTGVLQFSRQYYKGVIAGKTQDTARAIVDDVTRAIQLNPGTVYTLSPSGSARGYCIGTVKRYSYILNSKIVDSGALGVRQSRHALVADSTSGCSSGTNAVNAATVTNLPGVNAREMLGPNMRLSKFSITGGPNVYTVTVRVVYGDEDLLCSPTAPGSCAPNGSFPAAKTDLTCKGNIGGQFCAASELTTTVQKRVN